MKAVRTILFILIAGLLLLPSLPVPAAAEVPANMAQIPGIDYGRITQKAYGGSRTYPVELKLGDLTFQGELTGDYGLTYEELNKIIRQTLDDQNLTVDRIVLVREIAAKVQSDAALQWGDQVVEGILSFLPIPGTTLSVGDYYAYKVHGNEETGIKSAIFSESKAAASEAIERAAKLSGKVGRVGRAASKVASVPMLGQLINTAMVAAQWKEGSERFDSYLKLLEENLAIINNFYATCSQRAAALVEGKDENNVWKIRFDRRKCYQTYNCTFWGVSGNLMSCTVSGELTSADNNMAGTYTGTLWVELSAADFSPLERDLEKTTGLSAVRSLIYSMGSYQKTSDEGPKTVLTREAQGTLTVRVLNTDGTVTPEISGTLTSGGDETTFSFSRRIVWQDDSMSAYGSVGVTEAAFTSSSVDSVTMDSTSTVTVKGEVGAQEEGHETFQQNPGTAFRPLETAPVILIRFP